MKKFVRIVALVLCLMMLAIPSLAEGGRKAEVLDFINGLNNVQIEGANAYTTSFDEMAALLNLTGEGVDMLSNAGYVKKYDGTYEEIVPFADKAVDFGGVYLIWYDLLNGSDYASMYAGMAVNGGTIVISGGMYVVETAAVNGAYVLAFAADCDEQVKNDAIAALKAVDAKKPSIALYNGTELAVALQKAKKIAIQDFAQPTDLNTVYTYVAEGKDWVGYYDAETNPNGTESGYTDPYDKTYTVAIATSAMKYGDITIYYFDTTDSMFQYYGTAKTWESLNATVAEDGTAVGTVYADIDKDWNYDPFTANGTAYAADGEVVTFSVDAVIGSFAIVVEE